MKRKWLLLLWLVGILAPMAWLARFIPGYDQLFNFVFGPVWMHWLSHALLFAVLAFLLLTLLVPQEGRRWPRVAMVLGIVLLTAFAQERIQLWYKARAWGGDEWFDLGVDLMGATAGLLAWASARARRWAWGRWAPARGRAKMPADGRSAATDDESGRAENSGRPAIRHRRR